MSIPFASRRALSPRSAQRKIAQQRTLSPVALDPVTRQIRRGTVALERAGGVLQSLVIRLPLRLPSPNAWLGMGRWHHHRQKRRWATALTTVLAEAAGRHTVAGVDPPCRLLGLEPCREPRALHIQRWTANRAGLVKDNDNLHFAAKFLRDEIVKTGLLHDDSDAWLTATTGQAVSPDGRDWTEITITPRPTPAPGD